MNVPLWATAGAIFPMERAIFRPAGRKCWAKGVICVGKGAFWREGGGVADQSMPALSKGDEYFRKVRAGDGRPGRTGTRQNRINGICAIYGIVGVSFNSKREEVERRCGFSHKGTKPPRHIATGRMVKKGEKLSPPAGKMILLRRNYCPTIQRLERSGSWRAFFWMAELSSIAVWTHWRATWRLPQRAS